MIYHEISRVRLSSTFEHELIRHDRRRSYDPAFMPKTVLISEQKNKIKKSYI